MITNNNSWSLGPTPNKSLEPSPQAVAAGVPIETSIPIHLPGDLSFLTTPSLRTSAFAHVALSDHSQLPAEGTTHSFQTHSVYKKTHSTPRHPTHIPRATTEHVSPFENSQPSTLNS